MYNGIKTKQKYDGISEVSRNKNISPLAKNNICLENTPVCLDHLYLNQTVTFNTS